ncbi:hypothetical protein CLV71_12091 [Actinophytocola oryzae]|uniref:Uncharacterized protein n=1 Tax=Actinophytocola oryzae TaxID=502181 RepID=A0A4V3FQX7_9PSEU|nr:hypothetical protein CLV71_12091 [Actinophytocola oryzae]
MSERNESVEAIDDMDGLDLLIPAPRRSQENAGVR